MIAAVLTGVVLAGPDAGGAAPERVVSLNVCTDQLVVRLLPDRRIAAVSDLAADPAYSAVAERAAGLPVTHGRPEAVVARDPDLVLASRFTDRRRLDLLRRLGYRVKTVAPPSSLDGIRERIRSLAGLFGVSTRGEAVIRRFDRRLARARPGAAGGRVTAAVYEPGGVTAGQGGLRHAVLRAAGLVNAAARLGVSGTRPLAPEKLVMAAPDVLVLQTGAGPGWLRAAALLDHPALRALRRRAEVVRMPARLWNCGGPQVTHAVARLAAARRRAIRAAARGSR